MNKCASLDTAYKIYCLLNDYWILKTTPETLFALILFVSNAGNILLQKIENRISLTSNLCHINVKSNKKTSIVINKLNLWEKTNKNARSNLKLERSTVQCA